ncbi:hypothetical protein SEA_JANEEMI_36 [Arthrobacter phage Janeemi]|uniref:Uncharacterized protein n=2 Tax=Yangvirus TaxID=2733221 RepID=A0A9E7QJE7_9CAUD|nr:hypothetical protein PQD82_gp36 [Arthrobacter phage Phives]QOP65164.1 hypothetical protein SEA_PHIVES_36 [Arthrobacter phage Phives]UVK63556.1 hypothetical protein SEA_JANEEMI_36 [Arthrobacter phage Janeemi]
MSSRPGVVTKQTAMVAEAEGYQPYVTAEFRVFWPPSATDAEIEDALTRAVAETRARIELRRRGNG